MTDQTTPAPINLVKFIDRGISTRTLSKEFYARSPDTQKYIKHITGGITPTSQSNRERTVGSGSNDTTEETEVETIEERFNVASDYEKEMMFRYGLIPPNCKTYRDYAQKHAKTT